MGARGGRSALLAVAAALWSVAGWAQVPQAPGLKVGDGRLHPFLEVDGRFDSAVGFFERNAAGAPIPSSDVILHFRPGLKYALQTPSTMVDFMGSGEYLLFTGLLSPSTNRLSRFHANVGIDARFNTDGPVEVQVGDTLARSDRTQNATVGVGVISLFNNASLAVPIHPGGRALEVTPKVSWAVEFFEPLLTGLVEGCPAETDVTCNPSLVSQMNYSNVHFGLNGRWKFLPKTAVVLDAGFDLRTYFTSAANRPGSVLRVQAGMVGLISPRIGVTLMAGYGGDFAGSNLHTVIGHAELAYTVSERTRVSAGYLRTAVPVPALGVMTDDRGYLRGGLSVLGGRLVLNAQLSADLYTFISQVPRSDVMVSALVGPTVYITSWFDVGASYSLGLRTSSAAVTTLNFVRHEATLRLNLHY